MIEALWEEKRKETNINEHQIYNKYQAKFDNFILLNLSNYLLMYDKLLYKLLVLQNNNCICLANLGVRNSDGAQWGWLIYAPQ